MNARTRILRSARLAGSLHVILAGALAFALAGCYTMMRHPSTDTVTARPQGSCLRCHGEEDPALFESTAAWIDYYTYSATPWINYYGSPWWQDTYWYRDEDHASPAGRIAWGRLERGQQYDQEDIRRHQAYGISAPPAAPSAPPATPAPAVEGAQKEPEEKPATEEPKRTEPTGRTIRR